MLKVSGFCPIQVSFTVVDGNVELIEYDIQPDDQYLVIASDGIWEFMANEEVAKIASPFFHKSAPEAAANALVKEAHKRWKIVRIDST